MGSIESVVGAIREDRRTLPDVQGLKDSYRTDIDGLRAIAVTAVVLFHAGLSTFSGGFVGVDIFFVISGYLIGAHIYRDVSKNRFSLANFYRLRAKRILPALFAVLLFCYAMSFLVLSPVEMRRFGAFCRIQSAVGIEYSSLASVELFFPMGDAVSLAHDLESRGGRAVLHLLSPAHAAAGPVGPGEGSR